MEQYNNEKSYLYSLGYDDRKHIGRPIDVYELTGNQILDIISKHTTWLTEQGKKDKLTLQECKDEVAKKNGHGNWDLLCFTWAGFIKQIEPLMNEAAEMYAQQFIFDDQLGTVSYNILMNRIKELEKEEVIPAKEEDEQILKGCKWPECSGKTCPRVFVNLIEID